MRFSSKTAVNLCILLPFIIPFVFLFLFITFLLFFNPRLSDDLLKLPVLKGFIKGAEIKLDLLNYQMAVILLHYLFGHQKTDLQLFPFFLL